ncbi:MAG: hypothetical protein CYG60_15040 [Actinobacteria bacterium]|nr:MAG: hypothetical protein CYG60_15040 [Actinomycetota bacterium]
MASGRKTSLPTSFAPPKGLLGRARFLFLLVGLFMALLAVPIVLSSDASGGHKAAAIASLLFLGGRWTRGYARERFSAPWDLPEGLALFLVNSAAFEPTATLGLVINGMIFRSLYGSTRGVAGALLIYLGAFLLAVAVTRADAGLDYYLSSVLPPRWPSCF